MTNEKANKISNDVNEAIRKGCTFDESVKMLKTQIPNFNPNHGVAENMMNNLKLPKKEQHFVMLLVHFIVEQNKEGKYELVPTSFKTQNY